MLRVWQCVGAGIASMFVVACSPAPCTTCSDVAGIYNENAQPNFNDCGDGLFLEFTGDVDRVQVMQSGSDLALDGAGMTGVLHADNSASFGPVPAVAEPIDGGEGDFDGEPQPGKLYLEGWFSAGTFEGTYMFIANSDGCEIDSPTIWTP